MNPDRFVLSIDEYLAEKDVLFYLEDAVHQLLEHKDEYVQFGVPRYFAEYFESVRRGNHVLFREFSYVKATAHNRRSFMRLFWKCFRQIGKNGDLLAAVEYGSLLQLLCPDFPADVAHGAARIVLMDDAMDCLMSFADFLYAFQIQFYYEEFLENIAAIYRDLLSGKSPNTVIVPTSTSVEQLPQHSTGDDEHQEGVEASVFGDCVEALCERYRHKPSQGLPGPPVGALGLAGLCTEQCCHASTSHPPASAIKEILGQVERVSLYGFLTALARHEGVNEDIGSLPSKAALLIDPEMDRELERLVAQVSVSPTSSGGNAAHREPARKASPRKSLHHRKRIEMESDGSNEETDSSEN